MIREDPDGCRFVAAGLAEGPNHTYTFNVFDVSLDFEKGEVRVDDILDLDVSEIYPLAVVREALTGQR